MAALLAAFLSTPTHAADTPAPVPTRVRGTIASIEGQKLVVKARNGQTETIALAPGFAVGTFKKVDLAAIKMGDYVGTAAVTGENGHLKALELHLFPEAMRGTGEGFMPFDLTPESTMTNATVGQITEMSANGRTLTLTYKDGQKVVDVPPDVPVVTFVPGDVSMLQPGMAVIVFAAKQADESLAANRVMVESGGVKPPM